MQKRLVFKAFIGLSAFIGICFISVVVALNSRTLFAASEYCLSEPNGEKPEFRFLIVGDSWASGGRLLPSFAGEFLEVAGSPLIVCSVGYPGRIAGEIADGVGVDYNWDFSALLGGRPDAVVVIAGINDSIQQVGAKRFVAGLEKLSRIETSSLYFLEIPYIDEGAYIPHSFLSSAKLFIFRVFNDFGSDFVMPKYRAAARESGIETIDFSEFSPNLRIRL